MKKRRMIALWIAAALVIGGMLGWIFGNFGARPNASSNTGIAAQVRANLSQFKFINPPLYSDGPSETSSAYVSFRSSMNAYISSAEEARKISDASVYFRDLNTGRWVGVNEDDLYRPSSMLKVLNMMAALTIAQSDPGFLQKSLWYQVTDHSDQYYKPAKTLSTGEHTVQELINIMVIDSDNDALHSLDSDKQIDGTFGFLYSLFRLPTVSATSTNFMSPKSYSALFRVLYNSSLFPWGLSEQVLDLLSHTSFDKGLVAGVPAGTVVSHKFGENTAMTSSGTVVERELHDCGIIYYPGHPYLLCVMTKGQDYPTLETVISDISKMAYGFVQSGTAN